MDSRTAVGEQARERSLRYLDFLEAYHLARFPPVRDIADYKDVQLVPADVPENSPGVEFAPGSPAWLSVDLVDLPVAPLPPAESEDWLAGPVTAREPPLLRHPDPVARALIAIVEDSPGGDLDYLDRLDGAALEARGIVDVPAGEALSAALRAHNELERAQDVFEEWLTHVWRPWSERWLAVETGRLFYKQLFDLRVRLERERETFELVWGFGRTRWMADLEGKPLRADHPLLAMAVEVEFDRASGRLQVLPEGSLVVETAWTIGLTVSDRQGLAEGRAAAEQLDIDPWGPGRVQMSQQLLRALDQDGRLLGDGERVTFGEEAVTDPQGWVLFVRRRQPNLRGFIDTQRKLYGEGVEVPAPFAALVVDEPSLLDDEPDSDLDDLGDDGDATIGPSEASERELLPLPANDEQLEIVALARSRAGVTAQGPPGTGKSHTIANLVSHYVAYGKRVLVTAEKEQALKVLIEKIPEDIRGLCVPVLGSDAAGRAHLQRTVAEIAAGSQRRSDHARISRLEAQLDDVDANYSATTNLLRTRRAAETGTAPHRPATVPADEWTPSTAAAWATAHQGLAGIEESIDRQAPPPLTDGEYVEVDQLCRRVTTTDALAALSVLPDPDALPAGGRLASLHEEVEYLRGVLSEVDDSVHSWDAVDRAGTVAVEALVADLELWVDWHTKAAGTWIAAVVSDSKDQALAAGWQEFAQAASYERDSVLAINRSLAAHSVSVSLPPEIPPNAEFIAGLNEARARFAAGRSVGAFQRAAKRALERCLTNGHAPASVADLDLIMADLSRSEYRRRLVNRWTNLSARVAAPALPGDRPVEDVIGERIADVNAAMQWSYLTWPQLAERLSAAGVKTPADPDSADLSALAHTCRILRNRARLVEIQTELGRLAAELQDGAATADASPLWAEFRRALDEEARNRWDNLAAEVRRLTSMIPDARRRRDLLERLRQAAPGLAAQVERNATPIDPGRFEQCWAWRQLDLWLSDLDDGPQPAQLQGRLEQLARDRRRVITNLVAARAWASLAQSIDDRRRTALNRFTTANAKLGKGTGRYAPQWAAEARMAMLEAQDAVPVWIMPLHRALTSFRPAATPPFDVVIIDEASQVGMLETLVLGLGRRAIIVGDDQQTSPELVGVERQSIFDLIDVHLATISDRKTRFSPDNSLYDLGRQRFPQVVQLREHFRCLPRIIEFSSQRWYSGSIIPLRDRPPRPGWQPVGTVFVPSGVRRYSDDTNIAEAEAVVDLIAQLAADAAYDEMTFGVVTLLGSGQAPLISGMLFDHLGPRFIEDRNIRVGQPADFQGDERDVVILSTVVAHDPDRRIGATTGAPANRRINVAASRAANQMWMIHSIQTEDLHPDDPRRWLLEYCSTPVDEAAVKSAMDRTESKFEADVLKRILARGYSRVHAQYPVGGYRIDLVIEGPESRLAVECDGDYWHGPDAWDHDRARQTVLERADWTFERIRGSSFYRDPDAALEPLWQRLDELAIPTGDWAGDIRPGPARRVWPDDFPDRLEAVATISSAYEEGQTESDDGPVSQHAMVLEPDTAEGEVVSGSGTCSLPYLADRLSAGTPTFSTYRISNTEPSAREVRQWARDAGYQVGERGRLHPAVVQAWNDAFPDRPFSP